MVLAVVGLKSQKGNLLLDPFDEFIYLFRGSDKPLLFEPFEKVCQLIELDIAIDTHF